MRRDIAPLAQGLHLGGHQTQVFYEYARMYISFFKKIYFNFHCTILDNQYRCKINLKSVTRYCKRLLLKGGLIIQEIYSSNTNETSTDFIARNTCKLSGFSLR